MPGGDCERFQTAEDLFPGAQGLSNPRGSWDLLGTFLETHPLAFHVKAPISLFPKCSKYVSGSFFFNISTVNHDGRCFLDLFGGGCSPPSGHSGLEKPQFDPQMVRDSRDGQDWQMAVLTAWQC